MGILDKLVLYIIVHRGLHKNEQGQDCDTDMLHVYINIPVAVLCCGTVATSTTMFDSVSPYLSTERVRKPSPSVTDTASCVRLTIVTGSERENIKETVASYLHVCEVN